MGEILQKKYGALRKCLAFILSIVMVLSTMTFTVAVADDEPSTSTSSGLEISTWTITVNGTTLTDGVILDVTEGDDVYIVIEWEFDGTYDSDDNYEKTIDLGLSGVVLDNTYYTDVQYIYVGGEKVGEWIVNNSGQIEVTLYSSYLKGNSGKYGGFEINGNVDLSSSTQNADKTYNITLGQYTYKVSYTPSAGYISVSKSKGTTASVASDGTVTQEFTVTIKGHSKAVTLSSISDTVEGYTLGSSFDVTYPNGETINYSSMDAVSNALANYELNDGETITIKYTATADLTSVITSSDSYNKYTNYVEVEYIDGNGNSDSKDAIVHDVNITKPSVSKTATSYDESTGTITWTISVNPGSLTKLDDFKLDGIKVTDTADSNQNEGEVTIPWTFFTDDDNDGVYTYTYTTTLTSTALSSATTITAYNSVDVEFMSGIEKSTSASYNVTKSLLDKSDGVYDESTGLIYWEIKLYVPDTGLTGTYSNTVVTSWWPYVATTYTYLKVSDYFTNSDMTMYSVYIDGTQVVVDGTLDESTAASFMSVGTTYPSPNVYQTGFDFYLLSDYVDSKKGDYITIGVYTKPGSTAIYDGAYFKNTAAFESAEQNETDDGELTYTAPTSALEKTGTISSSDSYIVDYEVTVDLNTLVSSRLIDKDSVITITDIIPDGMEYVTGSLNVFTQYYGSNGWYTIRNRNLSAAYKYSLTGNTLTVDASMNKDLVTLENTYSEYVDTEHLYLVIQYQTKLTADGIAALAADDDHQITYTNTATATTDDNSYSKTTTADTILTQKNVVTKTATANTDYSQGVLEAEYEVTVNPDALTLGGGGLLTATDVLESALILDVTTIKVYDSNAGAYLTAGTDYYYTYDSDSNTLTLKIPDGKALVLTYTAYINAEVGTKLTGLAGNNFTLYADYVWNNSDDTSITTTVTSSRSWAGYANLEVFKYSNDGSTIPLEGAKFTVYETIYTDGNGYSVNYNKIINNGTDIKTDANGKAVIQLDNDYYGIVLALVETSAPDGYQLDTTPYYFVMLKAVNNNVDTSKFVTYNVNMYYSGSSSNGSSRIIYMENNPSITVDKTDMDGNAIEDVIFGIYSDSSCKNLVEKITTNGFGIAQTSASYATGTYYLKEISTPSGYVANTKVYVLEVTNNGSSITVTISNSNSYVSMETGSSSTISFKNELEATTSSTATITVKKTKSDKTTLLDGASFTLTSEDVNDLSSVIVSNASNWNAETDKVTFITGTSQVEISNLLSGIYILTETYAPEGYVSVGACKIVITADTSNVTVTLDGTYNSVSITDTTITVVNNTETPTPVTETPTPVTETPTPVTETPTPVTETPTPVTETPTPVTETPTPVTETPTPVTETPTPVTETPTPVTETPVPTATDTPTPTPLTTKISIKKTDGEGNAIEGVIFGIYSDKDCTTAIDILTTDSNGEATSTEDYEAGTYYLKEISAPDEYVKLSKDVYVITLGDETTYVSISIDGDDQVSIENRVIVVVNLTVTPTNTATETPTPVTETPTPVTETPTPVTETPVPTATDTPVPTAIDTPVPAATDTPVPTATDTPVPTATDTPVPTAMDTPVPTATDTPVPTATDTPVPSATDTPVPSATDTPVPTATDTPVPTATDTPVPTATDTPTPTPLTTKVSIKKTDGEGNAIEGVIFGIYSDKDCTNEIETLTTNASGEATSTKDYEAGTYYLKEISAPDEYVKLSKDVYVITLDDETTYVSISIDGDDQVSIENQVIVVVNLTVTPTNTSTETPTPVTETPVPTATDTPVPSATDTPVPTATDTPVPTATDTPVPTATDTPTATPTDTPTDVPTATPTDVPTATPTDVPTATPTDVPTATPTDVPTATPTDVPTATPTDVPTATPTPTTSVKISKVDIANGEEVEGATLQILDASGNVVAEWVSTDTPQEITGLETGVEYTLRETVAPTGYEIATDTTFVLDENGEVDTSKTTTTVSDTGVLLVEDTALPTATPTDVPTATPTDTPTATPTDVPTATPTDIPTATPTDAPTATATPTPEAVATAAATATPTPEAVAAATATPTPTPVSEEDSNLIVEVLDEDTGEPVEGAVVRITDAYGNSVDLVTGKEGKVFGDFEIGDYTIEVISVPDGYTVTTGQTTTVTLVENETAEHQAKIAKLDGAQLGDSDSGTLPITGMLVWPISLLSILGALFTVGGVIDNRRRRTK